MKGPARAGPLSLSRLDQFGGVITMGAGGAAGVSEGVTGATTVGAIVWGATDR